MSDERTEKMGYLKITLLADNCINTFGSIPLVVIYEFGLLTSY